MKHKLCKLAAMLCAAACILCLTACSAENGSNIRWATLPHFTVGEKEYWQCNKRGYDHFAELPDGYTEEYVIENVTDEHSWMKGLKYYTSRDSERLVYVYQQIRTDGKDQWVYFPYMLVKELEKLLV
jgi:hypothetical protein